jgi:hypothetical protein
MYVLDVLELKGFKRSWWVNSRVSEKIGFKVHRFSGKVDIKFFFLMGVNEKAIMKKLYYGM